MKKNSVIPGAIMWLTLQHSHVYECLEVIKPRILVQHPEVLVSSHKSYPSLSLSLVIYLLYSWLQKQS